MSLILKLRHVYSFGFLPKPYISSLKPLNSMLMCRNYAQAALKMEEEEIEEVEIDPRKLPSDYDPSNFDPGAHRTPPSDAVFRLVDDISSLTLRESAELGSILMKKMGMTEAPVMGVLNPGVAAGLSSMGSKGADAASPEAKEPEKTVFELKLESFEPASKIKVIKEIRAITELGLKEAKDLVEKAPAIFKKGVSKEEAEQIMDKLKAIGGKVVME